MSHSRGEEGEASGVYEQVGMVMSLRVRLLRRGEWLACGRSRSRSSYILLVEQAPVTLIQQSTCMHIGVAPGDSPRHRRTGDPSILRRSTAPNCQTDRDDNLRSNTDLEEEVSSAVGVSLTDEGIKEDLASPKVRPEPYHREKVKIPGGSAPSQLKDHCSRFQHPWKPAHAYHHILSPNSRLKTQKNSQSATQSRR